MAAATEVVVVVVVVVVAVAVALGGLPSPLFFRLHKPAHRTHRGHTGAFAGAYAGVPSDDGTGSHTGHSTALPQRPPPGGE